ncbi:hypothetical protein ACRAWD_10505 [Caulobacter segnis]
MLRETQALLAERREEIETFLSPLLAKPDLRVILTGAGTSAFIGECLTLVLSTRLRRRVEAIPTTDLVSAPNLYFEARTPTLLVSFDARATAPRAWRPSTSPTDWWRISTTSSSPAILKGRWPAMGDARGA